MVARRVGIAQGLFEGLCVGEFFSLLFAPFVFLMTRASFRYDFAAQSLLAIVAGAFGLMAYRRGRRGAVGRTQSRLLWRALIGGPEQFGPMLGYAWAGGST